MFDEMDRQSKITYLIRIFTPRLKVRAQDDDHNDDGGVLDLSP